jgi:hypothetical protein
LDTDVIEHRWFACSEKLASAVDMVKSPPYTWSKALRRTYVLTFPVSPLVRLATIVALIATFVVVGLVSFIGAKLECTWRGLRSMWD